MKYNYSGLWNLLARRSLSKTDLRIRTGISTATLAKLSAGEAVSLDVLSKISGTLGAGLDDIVSVLDNEKTKRWLYIGTHRKFLLHIIIYIDECLALYILGYATAYEMTTEGMDEWEITQYPGKERFYSIKGYSDSDCLKDLLIYAENSKDIRQFVLDREISIKGKKVSQKIVDKAMDIKLCNGKLEYHAPYILMYKDIRRFCSEENMPIISPYESCAVCEGLEGKEKRNLYFSNGQLDKTRMDNIYSILKEEFPNGGKYSNIGMLANFEIFSNLSNCYDEGYGINVTVESGDNSNSICQIIHITFEHEKIGKNIMAEFVGYNNYGVNPVCDILKELDCTRQNQTWTYEACQLISRFELKIWDDGRFGNGTGRLLYHVGRSLIMGIHIVVDVSELSYNLKDEWDSIISKSGKKEILRPRLVTHMKGLNSERINENLLIKKDFRNIICENKITNRGGFFDKGDDKQVDFLIWLKSIINEETVEKVIVIDPYIKAKSIEAILRCITDYNGSVEIFLDTDKDKDGKNTNDIKSIKDIIEIILPYDFSVFGVSGVLHDRYVILMGREDDKVYMLSNSIDSVADNYASASVLVDESVAIQIIRHYLELFSNTQKDVIIKSEKKKNEVLGKSIREYINLPEGIQIPESICSVNDAKKVIDSFITEGKVYFDSYKTRLCIEASYFLSLTGALSHENLLDIHYFIVNRINYEPFTWMNPILYESVCFLKNNSIQDYFELSSKMARVLPLVVKENEMISGLMSMLIMCAASDMEKYPIDNNNLFFEECLKSDKVFFKAISVEMFQTNIHEYDLSAIISPLNTHLDISDYLTVCIYYLMIMKDYSKDFIKRMGEVCISKSKEVLETCIAKGIGDYLSELNNLDKIVEIETFLQPLYTRCSDVISDIMVKAVKVESISFEFGQNVLVDFIMKRFENYENAKHVCFTWRDIEESFRMLDKMHTIISNTPVGLKKRIKKIEINASRKLYIPFLKDKDYNAWKMYIDVLGCMVCLELYLSEWDGNTGSSIALKEYKEISANYDTLLKKNSEIYRAVMAAGNNGKITDIVVT